jgi:preprotein translocase subunit SecE
VAKQTRAQRRARRAEQERQQNGGDGRPVPRQAQIPAGVTSAEPAVERQLPGSGVRRFVGESVAELKKVEWPGQQQLIQGTAVVLIACIIVGTYLWLADLAFKRLVQNVLLGQ